MARCKYCKAKLGTLLQPDRNTAGYTAFAGRGICSDCWKQRRDAKTSARAERRDRWERAAEQPSTTQPQRSTPPALDFTAGRQIACPNGHVSPPTATVCPVCGVPLIAGGLTEQQLADLVARRAPNTAEHGPSEPGHKECPMCAELVKERARICRFCRHEFDKPH